MSNLKNGRGNSPYYKTMDIDRLTSRWLDFMAKNRSRVTGLHSAVFFLCLEIYIRTERKEGFLLDSEKEAIYLGELYGAFLDDIIYDLSSFGFITYKSYSRTEWRITLKWHSTFNYN